MENTFNSEYEKNWLPLAHVLGVIGNGIFIFICWYEYDILYRLWGSLALALCVPPFLELLQWFFSKIAVKQRIFEEQQEQLKEVNDHMTAFCLIERNQQLRDGERADFIEKNSLLLLRGDMIPPSAINGWLIYSFVVATLVASTLIITLNRNESNQKVIDLEVKTALSLIDSLHNDEIELNNENVSAKVNVIALSGSIDKEKTSLLQSQMQNIDAAIAEAREKHEVIKMSNLKKDRKKILAKFNSLPLGKEYEKQKAEEVSRFTTWKIEKDSLNKQFKAQKENTIRGKYTAKGTRINWLAIITNILYVVFQYVIVKIRTITGSWSFDMIELIGSYLSPSPIKQEVVENDEIEKNVPEIKTPDPKGESTIAKVVKMEAKKIDIPTPSVQPTYQNSRHSVYYETMKLSHLQQFFEESNFNHIAGYTSAEQIWSCLKNGRKAIIAGKMESKSVETMNVLLDSLADNYAIVVNPNEKVIETITPQLVKRIIESKSKTS